MPRPSLPVAILALIALSASAFAQTPAGAQAAPTPSGASAASALNASAAEPVKVVYHLTEGIDQAARALGNIRNHLRAAPDTKVVVVAVGDGIRFLLRDARDRSGKPFDSQVAALTAQGVAFRVCGNTLSAHQVPQSELLTQATVVQAGVAEVARLQFREGYAYLRP